MQNEGEKMAEKEGDPGSAVFGSLIGIMMFGGKDTQCEACPVFIQRLRESPNLIKKIKGLMQNWEGDTKADH